MNDEDKYAMGYSVAVIVVLLILALLTGCVSTARVERQECKAVVQGSMFSFWTPSVIEECRPEIK